MNVVYGQRRSGKTTELIKQCSQDRYSLIVAPNKPMCDVIFQQSKEMGYNIPQPITFHAFLHGQFNGYTVEKFYFDELIMSLETVTKGVPIESIVLAMDSPSETVFVKTEITTTKREIE